MMEENAEQLKTVRNRKLHDALKNLAISFETVLDKKFFPEFGDWYDRVRVLLQSDAELIAKILERRPELGEEKLSRCLAAGRNTLKILTSEELCRNPPHASTIEGYQEELAFFLAKLLKEKDRILARGSFATTGVQRHLGRIFLEEYLKYENYLFTGLVTDFLICPLDNFICPKDIALSDQIAIRKLKQDEFHSLVDAVEQWQCGLYYAPESVLCIAVKDDKWKEQIQEVITLLRLLGKESVSISRMFVAYALPSRPWLISEPPEGTRSIKRPTGDLYTLDKEEELHALFTFLDKTKNVGYLGMSIRRFNLAHERERMEDSWIDLFISIESLFSKESEMTEVTHRLATRLSRALGGELFDGKRLLRNKIKEWYGVRSKIVHGGIVSLDKPQLQELEGVLRNSIVWFMNRKEYNDHDMIIDLLDLGV
jgi:hypothetical protein